MARTTTKTTKQKTVSSQSKAVAGKKQTATTTSGADDLASLALAAKDLEDQQRAQTGSQNSYISLLGKMSKALDEDHPSYIKGAKPLDYAITSKKMKLGSKIDVTILGTVKVYAEVTKKEKDSDMPKTVKFWMLDEGDVSVFPQVGYFDRELPNGNLLQPQHWVHVYLHDFPDIDDGLITFRSTGNRYYKELEKFLKAESSVCTELRFDVTHLKHRNEAYDKTDYYPKFELSGHNYRLADGKIVKTKDSSIDGETLREILTRSKAFYDSYAKMKAVAKNGITSFLSGGSAQKAIAYAEDDDDGEALKF